MNANTLIQVSVPDHLRGRVMAVYVTVFAGSTPVGGLISGAVAGAFGVPLSLAIGGLASLAVSALVIVIARRWDLLRPAEPVPAAATAATVDPDDVLA